MERLGYLAKPRPDGVFRLLGGQHNNAEDNNDETTTQKCTGDHGQWRSGQARRGLPVRGADTMWVTTAPSMLGNMATPFQGGVSTSDRKS